MYSSQFKKLSREPKSMILCESVKQTSQIYDLVMVAYSVSTPLTLGRGVSYQDGSIRADSHGIKMKAR
jgi:hypothetical protein